MRWVERISLSPALGLFLLLCLAIGSAKSHAEQLPIKTYTTADGLARVEINRIIQDSHGLHKATFAEAEGLPSRNVLPTAFAEDRDGDLWVVLVS